MEKFSLNNLSESSKNLALQRLTALWAFMECGIGGLMHSFKFPFTGLVVGGFAVLIITFIAKISKDHLSEIFKSLAIVLIVKLTISPQSPFTAYVAVVFQATLGYWIFYFSSVNKFSIILLSIICMLESSLQKLIVLTIFFGQDLWMAIDKFVASIAPSVFFINHKASFLIITVYLTIYAVGGLLIGLLISKIITSENIEYKSNINIQPQINEPVLQKKKRNKKIIATILLIAIVCLYLYFYNSKNAFTAILKYIIFTTTLIWFWFTVISPLLIRAITKLLQSKKEKYREQLTDIFEILPYFKPLLVSIWKESKQFKGLKRILFIIQNILIHSIIFNPKSL
jgi:hypothetical protein